MTMAGWGALPSPGVKNQPRTVSPSLMNSTSCLNVFAPLRPRREIRRDCGSPLLLVVVRDLDELERIAVGIGEVHPPPTGEHTLVDDVNRAEELDALSLELRPRRLDVVDEKRHVRGSDVVRHERGRGFAWWALVLEQLERRVSELAADLP